MSEILTERMNAEDQYRVVRLDSRYNEYSLYEMNARLDAAAGVHFTVLTEDKKPKHFQLSAEQVNVLIAAWLKFEDDVEAVKAAEAEHKEKVLAEAMKLANEHKFDFDGLQIVVKKSRNSNDYKVYVPAIAFVRDWYISSPDALLATVKDAITHLEAHIIWLEDNVLPYHEGDEDTTTVRNREMVAAYRAVKPKSPASSDEAPEAESEEALF